MGDLSPLLEARSVAVIGASRKPGSVGEQVVSQLEIGGFGGRVSLVNPRYKDMLPKLDEPVDLAVLAVANRHLEAQIEVALAAGARSLAIFASCRGVAQDGAPLQTWLSKRLAGVPVCGGNGMGFLNLTNSLRITGFFQPRHLPPGRVTFISHSGSLFSAMLHNHRHQTFNLVISAGNELTLTQADYVSYAIAQAETRVIALFTETVRDRVALAAAWLTAAARDIPVVVLKVGRTPAGAAAVATHSAALAGAYEPFAAFARAHGVHLVETMDEMLDTIAIFDSPRRPTTKALGAVHDSGGERTHLLDVAHTLGVDLATIGEHASARLASVLDEGLEPVNPVDAWGTGRGSAEVFGESLATLATDPSVGAVAFAVDLTAEDGGATDYADIAVAAAASTSKPFAVLANVAAAVDPVQAELLARHQLPLLRGLENGLRAFRHLFGHEPPDRVEPPAPPRSLSAWRARLALGQLDDIAALDLLAEFGVPVEPMHPVADVESALMVGARLGFPVALKALGLIHKTEFHGLRLGLEDESDLTEAWEELAALDLPIAVQRMAPAGIEIAFGMTNDPQVGPVMLVGAGGVLIEWFNDRTMLWPPVDHAGAARALSGLRVAKLLAGHRGRPPADFAGLAAALVAFSGFVFHLGDLFQSVDVNPLVVHPSGLAAVDALLF